MRDPLVRRFLVAGLCPAHAERSSANARLSTLNKVRQFLDDPMLRNIVAQRSAFDLGEIIDSGKIFVANLAAGRWARTIRRCSARS